MLQGLFRIQRRHSVTWNLCIQKTLMCHLYIICKGIHSPYTRVHQICAIIGKEKSEHLVSLCFPAETIHIVPLAELLLLKEKKDVLIIQTSYIVFVKWTYDSYQHQK